MERYFEGTPPTDEELPRLIVRGGGPGQPDSHLVRFGQDGRGPAGTAGRSGRLRAAARHGRRGPRRTPPAKTVEVKADPAGPLVAQVFKTRIDPFVQKINFIRVFSGTLKKDDTVSVVGLRKGAEARPAVRHAGQRNPADRRRRAGQIVAVTKMEDLRTGMSLGELTHAADPVPFADGRPGRHAQEPRRRSQALRLAEQDLPGGLHLPHRPRRADQGNGRHRHERTALANPPRAAQAPRQGRGRHQGAENPLPRNDPDQRRRQLSAQEADRRPRPVRRSPHPHVPAAQGREHRGVVPSRPASPR